MLTPPRLFVGRRIAYVAAGVMEPIDIVVAASGTVEAARLIRDAVDARYDQHHRTNRNAAAVDGPDRRRDKRKRRRPVVKQRVEA